MRNIKYYAIAILIAGLGTMTLNQSATAQLVTEEGDITGGAALSIGSSIGFMGSSEPGITLQGYYGITDEVRGGASFTYYLIGEEGLSASEFNLDAHYLFRNEDNLILYGLGGISIARVSVSSGGWGASGSSTGLNLGGGIEYGLGSFYLFGEPKVTLAGWGQFQLSAGARMRF